MKRSDQWRYVWRNAGKNKSRLFLTVLATAIGCAFLIVLVSVGYGLQESVVADVAGDAAVNEIEVMVRSEDGSYRAPTGADIAFFESIPQVRAVTRYLLLRQKPAVFWEGVEVSGGSVVSTYIPAEEALGFKLAAGAMPAAADEVILGYHYAWWLLQEEAMQEAGVREIADLVGMRLVMEVHRYAGDAIEARAFPVTVAGVGAPPAQEWRHDGRILISEELLVAIEAYTGTELARLEPPLADPAGAALSPEERTYDGVRIYTRSLEDVRRVADRLDAAGYATYSIVDRLERVNAVFTIMRAGLVLVGAVAVLIASIGIYNTMTMAVTERTQEIGIMKALGAHPRHIKRIFLLESAAIGALGAGIGVVVAFAVGSLVNRLLPWILETAFGPTGFPNLRFSSIPAGLVVFSVALSIGVALLSGVRPAVRATRVDVLQALRRDL